jgi:hypothetical protein
MSTMRPAGARGEELLDGRPGQPEHAPERRHDEPLPFVQGHVVQRRQARDVDDGDDGVEPGEAGHGGIDRPVIAVRGMVLVLQGKDDPRSLAGGGPGNGRSERAGAADQHDTPGEAAREIAADRCR